MIRILWQFSQAITLSIETSGNEKISIPSEPQNIILLTVLDFYKFYKYRIPHIVPFHFFTSST